MYGLPQSTIVKKRQLPKSKVFEKFDLKPSQRESFDADISRIDVVAVVSPATIPAIAKSENILGIYVLAVQLKRKEYDAKNITLLSRFIPNKVVFALHFEEQVQFAISHTKLITSKWQLLTPNSSFLTLNGLNLDAVWDNLVASIGDIMITDGKSVAEQIAEDDAHAKLMKQIEQLEHKVRTEKQPRKKLELFEKLKELKKRL